MAAVKLPWDLKEEILSRLPPLSLVRFRTSFLNNHLARSRPQIIFLTESKIYSIAIDLHGGFDPTIEAMELMHTTVTACDGFLFRDFWKQGVTVWNPWLRQVGWIEYEDKNFHFCGVGYDNSGRSEKGYKILGYFNCLRRVSDTYQVSYQRVAIYECLSHTLKFLDAPFKQWPTMGPLSLNGNLYWVTSDPDNMSEIFRPFCLLPCQKKHSRDELLLAVYKGDGFSLLKQCYVIGEIEIWVTKKKILGEEVVWIKLMTLPTTNLPKLVNKFCGVSYFIVDKTLILCCGDDQTGFACIYTVKEDMCKKIQIGSGTIRFSHCVYLPNFISVPLEFRTLRV
ncbi:hypothetical protein EUTSA_v10022098mg [Eutrema salsugineum]|uniref:Uncharacterized protein n=1 Tax=Eutrema salsugineum TaxID=72664 RepID=V4NNS9_EUTSA|nr:hypothetical protein EUTSA_v10022098mg [Eutrema salsugineum]